MKYDSGLVGDVSSLSPLRPLVYSVISSPVIFTCTPMVTIRLVVGIKDLTELVAKDRVKAIDTIHTLLL
jgi:hypothetical protein